MTSEIDDPSVETDSCDSLERVAYRPWLNGTFGAISTRRRCWHSEPVAPLLSWVETLFPTMSARRRQPGVAMGFYTKTSQKVQRVALGALFVTGVVVGAVAATGVVSSAPAAA